MYNVSENFKNAIKSSSRLLKTKVLINNNEYDETYISDMSFEDTSNPSGQFEIGAVASAVLNISLIGVNEVFETATIKPFIGLDLNGSVEYVPLGVFYVDDVNRKKDVIQLTCYDGMIKLEKAYFSDLTYPATISAVMNEICNKTGIQFVGTLPNYQIQTKPEGYTYREVVAFIAQMCAGFAKFDRDGKLRIKSYATTSETITADHYIDFSKKKDDVFRIDKITCQVGENTISKGALSAGGSEVQFENPFMTDAILTDIYNKLKDFQYMPMYLKFNGNPALECGDIVTLVTIDNETYKIPIMVNKLNFAGGLTGEIESVGETENSNQFSSSGSLTNKVERVVYEQALINEALIDKATIEDLEATNARIDDLITNDLAAINAAIQNLTASKADIEDLNAINAQIENLRAEKANITDLEVINARIDDLVVNDLAAINAAIQNLQADKANITDLEAVNARIDNLKVTSAMIENAAITTAKIAFGAITSALIADAAITSAKIEDASITSAKIAQLSVGTAHIIDAAITTAKIANAAVDTAKIKDASITNAKIANLAVGTAQIQDAAITTAKIANAAITSAKIGNAQIQNAHIATAAIDSSKIQTASITTGLIADGAITSAKIQQAAIGTAQIADASITDAKIANISANKINAGTINTGLVTLSGPNSKLRITGNRLQVFDNQATPVERVSLGDVNGDGSVFGFRVRGADGQTILLDENGVRSEGITDGAITNPKIADGAVGTGELQDGSVTNAKVANASIDTAKIKTASITTALIQDGAITSAKIQDAAISTAKIADAAITSTKIGNAQIGSAHIIDGSIGTAEIANAAITQAKIANLAVGTAQIQDAAITTAKIANLAVDTAKIKDGAITNAKISDATITGAKIANASITNAHIADATITSAKIANLDASKITSGTINSDRIGAASITVDKLSVSTLSAISANLGNVTAGIIDGVTIYSRRTEVLHGSDIRKYKITIDSGSILTELEIPPTGANRAYTSSAELVGNELKFIAHQQTFTGTTLLNVNTSIHQSGALFWKSVYDSSLSQLVDTHLRLESDFGTSHDGYVGHLYGGLKFLRDLAEVHVINYADNALGSMKADAFYFRYIRGNYNHGNVLVDHNNGNVTLSALGGVLYVGYYATNEVRMRAGGSDTHIFQSDGGIIFGGNGRVVSQGTTTYIQGDEIRATKFKSSADYVNFRANWVYADSLDINNGVNVYIRPKSGGEVRATVTGTTGTYVPVRASSFPTGSLAEYKQDIHVWDESALEKIRQSTIYEYRLKGEVEQGKYRWRQGLVIGEGYNTPSGVIDGDGVEQYLMNAWSWRAIQELDKNQQNMQSEIEWLKLENQYLKQKVKQLEEMIA
ncbi:hypothetical protein RI196_09945 [Aeribacillus composti]|uniref:Peptidase S74 domain-containing protein n=1 Tax=Aeribacillus composti TaxID=1868734 RepID=A0ABY9W644_9BACI|nr:hypothetical protein [Aeribacillus composti]WNF31632.1 hypothetical protein RI196_09945 [Aeribacillus composti]